MADDGPAEEASENASGDEPIPTVAPGEGKLPASDDLSIALLAHLLGALTLFAGPLVIWLAKRKDSPFLNDQGKEALNFQIMMTIPISVLWFLSTLPIIQCLAFLPFIGAVAVNMMACILGALQANKGKVFRYPFNIRLIS